MKFRRRSLVFGGYKVQIPSVCYLKHSHRSGALTPPPPLTLISAPPPSRHSATTGVKFHSAVAFLAPFIIAVSSPSPSYAQKCENRKQKKISNYKWVSVRVSVRVGFSVKVQSLQGTPLILGRVSCTGNRLSVIRWHRNLPLNLTLT